MPRWRVAARWAAGVALAVAPGCSSSQFECVQDSQCARDGVQGICQDVGYCSFADEVCASGQRFSDLAAELAGACVAPEGPGASSGGTGSPSPVSSTAGPGGGPTSNGPTTNGPTTNDATTNEPTTNDPVIDTTSGSEATFDSGSTTTETDSTSGASESATSTSTSAGEVTTTGEPPACPTPFVDEFNDGALGAGWLLYEEELTVVEVNTELRFTMQEGNESYATLLRGPLDVEGGYVQARLTDLPQAPTAQLVFDVRTGSDPAHEHRLVLEGHGALRIIDGGQLEGEVDLPPAVTSLDVRLGFEMLGVIAYSYRVNNGTWAALGSVTVDTDLSAVAMRVIVGAWDPLTVPTEVVRLDTVSGCFVDGSI